MEDKRDELVSPLVIPRPRCLGIVTATVIDGDITFAAYGQSGDPGKKLDEDGIFDVGSIAKVFTGLLLAEMVARREVSFDDPIAHHLPEGTRVPSQGGRMITLVDLATHTAGLPRLPPDLTSSDRFDPRDPYAHVDEQFVLEALERTELEGTVGETVRYSNFGFELLASCLGRAAGSSYAALLDDRVCKPLKLQDTAAWDEVRDEARLVPGHDEMGEKTPFWRTRVPGDGGVVSSARDLATFINANLDGAEGFVGKALEDARAARVGAGKGRSQGLGWVVDEGRKGLRYHWHNGGSGGYGSFMALEMDKKAGVVLLSNSHHSAELDQAGVKLLDHLCEVAG